MPLQPNDLESLLEFFTLAGRNRLNAEAWVHALVDIQESYHKIFDILLPEALLTTENSRRTKSDVLGDIREEFRHMEYHVNDVEGR